MSSLSKINHEIQCFYRFLYPVLIARPKDMSVVIHFAAMHVCPKSTCVIVVISMLIGRDVSSKYTCTETELTLFRLLVSIKRTYRLGV